MPEAGFARDETPLVGGQACYRLIYRSRSRVAPSDRDRELSAILKVARAKNAALGITGALLLYDDWFAQTLEGPKSEVRGLYKERIARDPRHASLDVLEEGEAPGRAFSRWAMALVGEHGEPDIPLVATKTGVTPAASHRTTNEQEAILLVMRDATRGYGRGS